MPYPSNFIKRHPEVLALEGWYDAPGYKFKISCRFADILRCSSFNGKDQHFKSCFAPRGMHQDQPRLRCTSPGWAIAYLPDKHGNFMGRAFVALLLVKKLVCCSSRHSCYASCCTEDILTIGSVDFHFAKAWCSYHVQQTEYVYDVEFVVTQVYGNKLNAIDIKNVIMGLTNRNVAISQSDIYL